MFRKKKKHKLVAKFWVRNQCCKFAPFSGTMPGRYQKM